MAFHQTSFGVAPHLSAAPRTKIPHLRRNCQPATAVSSSNASCLKSTINLCAARGGWFNSEGGSPMEKLSLIDAIQRLGLDYCFQEQIKEALHTHYLDLQEDHGCRDLHEAALRFRLLRQEGYLAPADCFSKFMDGDGNFRQEFRGDLQGLMSLYEASQLAMPGEDVLEKARRFSRDALLASTKNKPPDHPLASVVLYTLDNPHHVSLPKFTSQDLLISRRTHEIIKNGPWRKELEELARLEFAAAKAIHQKEIGEVTRWWTELGLGKKLKFARGQPRKWYMWPLAILPDPSSSAHRVELVKPISLIYVIDDIFDVYGSLDDLFIFTEAIKRWELSSVGKLPDYMKICLQAVYDITNDISHYIYTIHGMNPMPSLRKAWADLCDAFLTEAKWFSSGYIPHPEEYLNNGTVSSGVHIVLVHLLFLLGENISEDTVDVLSRNPTIITHTATILRLWDDLGTAQDEGQDGKDGSFIECFIHAQKGTSIESAQRHVKLMLSDAWKSLNKELIMSLHTLTFRKSCLNLARMVPLMYNYDQNRNLPCLRKQMKAFVGENTGGIVSP